MVAVQRRLGVVRDARPEEMPAIQALVLSAGSSYRDIGMAEVADNDPPSVAALVTYQRAGRAWVIDTDDRLIGCVLVDVVDGNAHIEQVSVHPDWARRGVGRMLIEYVAGWARARAMPAVTLTTFTDVPWNQPYYARIGFRPWPDAKLGPALAHLRAEERALGLDRWGRTAMRLDVAVQPRG